MEFRRTLTCANVSYEPSLPSTNVALVDQARNDNAAEWTVLVTADQTAGRGRHDRGWITPPDSALAVSVLVPCHNWQLPVSWLPLIAGSALASALSEFVPVGVKWPNDVLVADGAHRGRKLVGVLSELVSPEKVVVGSGINLFIRDADLPTERASSLLAAGADLGGATRLSDDAGEAVADQVLFQYLTQLQQLVRLASSAPEELRQQIERDSLTLGTRVRAHLAQNEIVDGRAVKLGHAGELVLKLDDGKELAVSAGDVEHLR